MGKIIQTWSKEHQEKIERKERENKSQSLAQIERGELFMFNIFSEKRDAIEKCNSDYNMTMRMEETAFDIHGKLLEPNRYLAVYGTEYDCKRYDSSMIPSEPTKII